MGLMPLNFSKSKIKFINSLNGVYIEWIKIFGLFFNSLEYNEKIKLEKAMQLEDGGNK